MRNIKFLFFKVIGFEKSLHILVINPRIDDDFFLIFKNCLLKFKDRFIPNVTPES